MLIVRIESGKQGFIVALQFPSISETFRKSSRYIFIRFFCIIIENLLK